MGKYVGVWGGVMKCLRRCGKVLREVWKSVLGEVWGSVLRCGVGKERCGLWGCREMLGRCGKVCGGVGDGVWGRISVFAMLENGRA